MARKIMDLATDSRGNYRRDLGTPQKRFYLGRNAAEAQRRVLQLEKLWSLVQTHWQQHRRTEKPAWDALSESIGLAIARGDEEAEIPVPDEYATAPPLAVLAWLRKCEIAYPLIRLVLPEQYRDTAEAARGQLLDEARRDEARAEQGLAWRGERQAFADLMLATPTAGLHAALDEYEGVVKAKYTTDGQTTEYGVVTCKMVRLLKANVEDRPLSRLDANALDFWQRHWEGRPKGKRGVMAVRTCVNVLKVQQSFLRWLDKQRKYGWRFPTDYERRKVKIEITQGERAAQVGHAVKAFTVEQLATLYEYARPWERAILLLGLNCGFAGKEVATLQRAEIRLDAEHPHYRKTGNWIMRIRKKTGVYGEWRLWPETVAAIRYAEQNRPASALGELFLTDKGNPLWTPSAKGNPNRQLANAWYRLLKRVRKDHGDLPPLSFKFIRKTAATMIRRIAGGEVAKIFLAHGQATSDDLLEVYAQRPFAKVFKALARLRRRLAPMYAKVADPFPAEAKETHPSLPLGTIRKIREMRRQGYRVSKICADLGVSRATVYRYS